ncbi:malonyl-ACP O-methyltransferase BioC [Thiomicrorhabdus sp.]|uniref:malonyl-ACP O-methyltransferase BioC n=1 Tax=Thiomicrorhabdus sp. TaxID=2039724 RepID=UPI0029C97FBB|nr:malonyl-ACP O-methyltransferase BioC [Thiomicrorhabdus sp.]
MPNSSEHALQPMNRQHIKQHFSHAAPSYDEAAILQKTVAERVDERLELTTVEVKTVLDIGAGTGLLTEKVQQRYPQAHCFAVDLSLEMLQQAGKRLAQPRFKSCKVLQSLVGTCRLTRRWANINRSALINADAYRLPFANGSVDLIVSNLMLQWCDDPDAVFKEFRRVLRPEGMLMFTTFGPDTLSELRQAWLQADPQNEHVNRFIDMHDLGDALIRSGFGQPVMDVEHFTLTYEKPIGVLKDLKAIGATQANQDRAKGLMGKQRFTKMLQAYEQFRREDKVPATYEVIHGHAWAAQEIIKGPDRNRSGLIEISLDEFARQTRNK